MSSRVEQLKFLVASFRDAIYLRVIQTLALLAKNLIVSVRCCFPPPPTGMGNAMSLPLFKVLT